MKSEHFTNLFPRCELLSRSGASVYSNLAKILVGRPEKLFLSELESSTRHRYASFAKTCCARMPVRISIFDEIFDHICIFLEAADVVMPRFYLMKSEHFTNLFPRCELLCRSGTSVQQSREDIGRTPRKAVLSELESNTSILATAIPFFAETCCARTLLRISIFDEIFDHICIFLEAADVAIPRFYLMKSEHFTNLFPRCELLSRSGASV